MRLALTCLLALALTSQFSTVGRAQARRAEIQFTPVGRAQIAVWIESADGSRFRTLGLTQSVSFRGIGNRPGATQMNSGYHWPYGRREGVLPIWAHRRIEFGGDSFERVIFNGRVSEGNASSAGSANEPGNTPDDYYCLSFTRPNSDRDHLDAVSCASQFASNKGRYLNEADQRAGYSEPFETEDGNALMTALDVGSLYPPRRDITCADGCSDHVDVRVYNSDARSVMPEIDAITMATPSARSAQRIVFNMPTAWPDGEYIAYVEINVEGDYNDTYNDDTFPTPTGPSGAWDSWAMTFGYPYRGQPSLLYRVPFVVTAAGSTARTSTPAGYGALHGEDGDTHAMDDSIVDDPDGAPGSGADRLHVVNDARLLVTVPSWDVCRQPNPPSSCGTECDAEDPTSCGEAQLCTEDGRCVGLCDVQAGCGGHCDPLDPTTCESGLLCADDGTCVDRCSITMQPKAITDFRVTRHSDRRHAHQYAHLRFTVPENARTITSYEVRVSTEPIVDEASFERALPAVQATAESPALALPVDGAAGDAIEVDFGGLLPELHYYVGIRSVDECNAPSEIATSEVTTTAVYFTTVTACFVATAAYGSPLADQIGVLRAFRDRHLMTNSLGRAVVAGYYAVGPTLANAIRPHPYLRSMVRTVLDPIVSWLDDGTRN